MSGDESGSDAADKFGSNRVERLQALYQNYRDYGMNVRFEIVPGVAHEEDKVTAVAANFFTQLISEEENNHK